MLQQILNLLKILWAGPWSLLGLGLGLGTCVTGGKGKRIGNVLEFHGGLASWLLQLTPVDAIAITIGHVVLGRTEAALDISRDHERVHVRQYERWGMFFVPAYFLLSGYIWFKGKDPYRDNPFEVEAYAINTPPHRHPG